MKHNTHHGGPETRRNAKTFATDFRRLTLIQNIISICTARFFDLRSSAQIGGCLISPRLRVSAVGVN